MRKAPLWSRIVAVFHRVFLIFFYLLLRITVGIYVLVRFKPEYDKPREVRRLRGSYVMLADHVHSMDMFIIGMGLARIIRWVAADANFRNPFMKVVMTLLAGSIAKAKNRSDLVTLSRMRLLSDMGCVIGVYQEGERSWDGVNAPPIAGTDKLIRFLKVPVVYAHLEGAYLEHPRWSWSGNHSKIRVRYELIIKPDEVKELSLSQINSRIVSAGQYDDWAYQAKAANIMKGEKRAEHVELICFTCPGCKSVNTLSSNGNTFACSKCGTAGVIDRYGSFVWKKPAATWPDDTPFENVRQWNLWQTGYYQAVLDELLSNSNAEAISNHLFWEDLNCVQLSKGKRDERMRNLGVGTARFYGDRIEYQSFDSKFTMPLEAISSFSVFRQHYTEFYYDKSLFRFAFTNRSISGYKWMMLFRLISRQR